MLMERAVRGNLRASRRGKKYVTEKLVLVLLPRRRSEVCEPDFYYDRKTAAVVWYSSE